LTILEKLRGTLQLFADDTAIVYSEETWDRLEEALNDDLERMKIWMQRNKLLINAKNSCYVTFAYVHKIADDVLGHVDSVEQLNFRKQIEFIS
jgi:hypothetical protein